MSKWSSAFRDPKWQKLRLQIMERDHFTCCGCGKHGDSSTLNAYHLVYEAGRAPWEYADDALATYCQQCYADRCDIIKKAIFENSNTSTDTLCSALLLVETYPLLCVRICDMIIDGIDIEDIEMILVSMSNIYRDGKRNIAEKEGAK